MSTPSEKHDPAVLRARFEALKKQGMYVTEEEAPKLLKADNFSIEDELFTQMIAEGVIWPDTMVREGKVYSLHGLYRAVVSYLIGISRVRERGFGDRYQVNAEIARGDGAILFEEAPQIAKAWLGVLEAAVKQEV